MVLKTKDPWATFLTWAAVLNIKQVWAKCLLYNCVQSLHSENNILNTVNLIIVNISKLEFP